MSFEDPYIKSIDCSSCKCHSSAPCSIAIILTFKIGEICTISTSFPQNDLLLSSGTLNPRVRVRRERTGMPFPFFFYTTGTSFPLFFFCILQLLTVIFHGSPSVIKLICLLPESLEIKSMKVVYTGCSQIKRTTTKTQIS